MAPLPIARWEPLKRPRVSGMKRRSGPFRKNSTTEPNMDTVNFPPRLPQRDQQPFITMTLYWGRGHKQSSGGLLGTGSKVELIPEDSKYHFGPNFQEQQLMEIRGSMQTGLRFISE